MRSALPLEFDSYCRDSLGTKYTQDDNSGDLVEVCEGTLRLIELYPDGHSKTADRTLICRSFDGAREHLEKREDDDASSDYKFDMHKWT